MLFKRLIPLFLFAIFLASFAWFFNSINEKKLIRQKVAKVFANLIVGLKPSLQEEQISSDLESSSSSNVDLSQTPTKIPTPVDPYANDPDLKDAQWGKAVQVSETGYRMKVGSDPSMATPKETFQALNLYRYTKGKSNLTWDDRLAKYALERATYICKNGSDAHAGFSDYIEKQEGYKTLGFYSLGENMSTYMRFSGTHLIEWIYAADSAHDGNQLGDWSHVGVGIYEDCSDLIFGNNMI